MRKQTAHIININIYSSVWDPHLFLTVCPFLSSTGLCWVSAGLLLQGNDSAWSATHSAPRRPRRQQQVWRRDTLPHHTELTLQPLKTPGPNRSPYPSPSNHPSTSSSPSLILPHLACLGLDFLCYQKRKRPDSTALGELDREWKRKDWESQFIAN